MPHDVRSACQAAWLRLWPRTGRRHQLRLHCAEVLHTPILGDIKYGGTAAGEVRAGLARALRSHSVCLMHGPCGWRAAGPLDQSVLGTRSPPMHLHLGRLTLQDWFGRGRPLVVVAPLPEHMLATGRALGLSARELERAAAEQAPGPAVAPVAPRRRPRP